MIHPNAHKALTEAARLYPRSKGILGTLANTPGPVSKWMLVDMFWPTAADDTPLRMHIHHLRTALGRDAIVTIRGIGYQLTDKGRAAMALMGT